MNKAVSLVEERTTLKELDMLITQYTAMHANYLSNKKTGNRQEMSTALVQLQTINNTLLAKLTDLQNTTLNTLYPKGMANQATIERNNPAFIAQLQTLLEEQLAVREKIKEYNNAFGEKEDRELISKAHSWRYIFYFVLAFVLSIFVVRAYTSDEQNSIELIVLVVAIAVVISQVYTSVLHQLALFGQSVWYRISIGVVKFFGK